MPRTQPRRYHRSPDGVPRFRLHKRSGQAVTTINGRDIYLGRHEDPAARMAYGRLIAEWLANGRQLPAQTAGGPLTISELMARYWTHVESYYRHADGSPTDEQHGIKIALEPLRRLYAATAAAEFGPLALRAVRDEMVRRNWSRKYVNAQVQRVRRMFRWAASLELVPAPVVQGLETIDGLRRGRTEAPERPPVRAVPLETVNAVLPHCNRQIKAMIQLMLHTGMRPGECCAMRPVDLDTGGTVWLFKPEQHKNAWRGRERVVYLGPRAQEVVVPFLVGRPVDAFMFSPAEADVELRANQRAARKTPMTPSHERRLKLAQMRARRKQRGRAPRDRYDVTSLNRAIGRACEAAGVEGFSPNQLRHATATFLRREYGLDAAQVILGHAKADVTQIYAELDRERALRIAAEAG